MPSRENLRSNLRKGVYVIPTSFTILNLFFGYRCIINATRGIGAITQNRSDLAVHFFEVACISLFFAAIVDTFDGLVARSLHATSEFGKEYDSLADVVSFGAAPAVLVYAWGLHVFGNLGGGIAFLFLVAVSLRLARFNVMTGKTDYRYFVGLPSPAGALTIVSIINYAPAPVTDTRFATVMLIVTALVAFAMVSPIRWRSQKGIGLQQARSPMFVIALAAIIAVALYWPREFFFIGMVLYLVSGPLVRLWSIAFPSRKPVAPEPENLEPLEAP